MIQEYHWKGKMKTLCPKLFFKLMKRLKSLLPQFKVDISKDFNSFEPLLWVLCLNVINEEIYVTLQCFKMPSSCTLIVGRLHGREYINSYKMTLKLLFPICPIINVIGGWFKNENVINIKCGRHEEKMWRS